MNNFTLRLITGLAGVAFIISSVLWNEYSYCFLFLLLSVLLHYEFLKIARHLAGFTFSLDAMMQNIITGIIIHALIIGVVFFELPVVWLSIFFPLVAILFISELFRITPHPFIQIGVYCTALLYIVLPVALLYPLGMSPFFTRTTAIGLLFFVWTSDTMAYFFGRAFGKHKLFERISPNKTWEGFLGGILSCVGMAFLVNTFETGIVLTDLIAMGIIVAVAGTLGDLVESMLKRSIEIKDSGSVLPGHGGFLDRFDAFLVSVPFVVCYLLLRGYWVI